MDFVELCSSQSCIGNVPGAEELHLICLKWSRLPLLSFSIMELQPGDSRFQPAVLHSELGGRARSCGAALRCAVAPGGKEFASGSPWDPLHLGHSGLDS